MSQETALKYIVLHRDWYN